jgi:succinylarginine dihydrolase
MESVNTQEFNFDGLVGPTHNYAGLSPGNLLSSKHAGMLAHPKAAALQGISKMRHLASLGIPQCVLPPQPRPALRFLRELGFEDEVGPLFQGLAEDEPGLLSAAYSASSMWTANAATVSPSSDTADGRVHLTPANLSTLLHRSIEAEQTARILRSVFSDDRFFVVHDPLSGGNALADEGAANHTRFTSSHGDTGVEFFVYGRKGLSPGENDTSGSRRFKGRQALEASRAVGRKHGLDAERVVFARQTPEAIDAGVFHNDVIAVGNENVLLYHEHAFVDSDRVLSELRTKLFRAGCNEFIPLCVQKEELSLEDAAECYLFNSQLVSLPGADEGMALIVPSDCQEHPRARRVLDRLLAEVNPVSRIDFIDVRQSMRNGGGPACLRLRVVLNEQESQAIHQGVILNPMLADRLETWVTRHYRESIAPSDLMDAGLLAEGRTAFAELESILDLEIIHSEF